MKPKLRDAAPGKDAMHVISTVTVEHNDSEVRVQHYADGSATLRQGRDTIYLDTGMLDRVRLVL